MTQNSWYHLRFLVVAVLVANFCCAVVSAQDTLGMTLQDAQKSFLQNNFQLLAAKYNIDANRALIRQAKVWDNPVLSTDQNIYDAQGGFLKHNAASGQIYLQLTQLIRTAGKRNKLAQVAEDNTIISSEQFDDLVRTLRYTLISDLFEIDHQLKLKSVFDSEIARLQILVTATDAQLKAGNVSEKDDIRVKALLFGLQNELVNIKATIIPVESELKLLIKNNDNVFIKPQLNYYLPDIIKIQLPPKQQLIDSALQNRPDAKLARSQMDYQHHNLSYQKALVKPDVSIGSEYDQRSSYAPNYIGLAISLPLNIFNKNKGNISSAQFSIKQQEVLADWESSKIANDVSTAYDKTTFYQQVNNLEQLDFSLHYDQLFQSMLTSYQKRQISLLEFIDFNDAYKESKLKLLDQHTALIKSMLELNYQVGNDVITINK
ncbi:MAG: TolC family protein [Ginsengibacter sp.]